MRYLLIILFFFSSSVFAVETEFNAAVICEEGFPSYKLVDGTACSSAADCLSKAHTDYTEIYDYKYELDRVQSTPFVGYVYYKLNKYYPSTGDFAGTHKTGNVGVTATCNDNPTCDKTGAEPPFYAQWLDIKTAYQACEGNCMVEASGASIKRYISAGLLETSAVVLSVYTGSDCTSTNSFTTALPVSGQQGIEQVEHAKDGSTEILVTFLDLDNDQQFTVDKIPAGDVESTLVVPEGAGDVLESVVDTVPTVSVVDNEPEPDWEQMLADLPNYTLVKYEVTTQDSTGRNVKNDVLVASTGNNTTGAVNTSTASTTTNNGTGDNSSGNTDTNGNVDLSGVESELANLKSSVDALKESQKAGDVVFSGACDDPEPVCDIEKPFCQQIKADYELKCADFEENKTLLTTIKDADLFDGRGEITQDIDLLNEILDITNIEISGSCPSNQTVNYRLGSYSGNLVFYTQPYCDFASLIRPMILFIGIFMVIRVVSKS